MSHSFSILPDRAIFSISGDDAREFLQGLVTSDVETLEENVASHTGLLTPQGKIMFDFFAVGQDDGYLIDCAADQIDNIVKRLTFYKLRAKVNITLRPEMSVAASWGGAGEPNGDLIVTTDPRLSDMGQRVYGPKSELEPHAKAQANDYHLHRIILGIPDAIDIGNSQTFPHEANFDQLNGVSFTKGCYVGQEVVSRMQHRGTARARIIPVTFEGEINGAGTEIRAGGKKIGHMLSVASGHGLALVRLDRAKSATDAGDAIEADGQTIHLRKPEWATFEM